jgi:hypothetical protein
MNTQHEPQAPPSAWAIVALRTALEQELAEAQTEKEIETCSLLLARLERLKDTPTDDRDRAIVERLRRYYRPGMFEMGLDTLLQGPLGEWVAAHGPQAAKDALARLATPLPVPSPHVGEPR